MAMIRSTRLGKEDAVIAKVRASHTQRLDHHIGHLARALFRQKPQSGAVVPAEIAVGQGGIPADALVGRAGVDRRRQGPHGDPFRLSVAATPAAFLAHPFLRLLSHKEGQGAAYDNRQEARSNYLTEGVAFVEAPGGS